MSVNILWCGGEDIDFQAGAGLTVVTTSGHFRSGYARCAIHRSTASNAPVKGTAWAAGPQTSFWLGARLYYQLNLSSTNNRFFGAVLSGTDSGLYVGSNTSNGSKLSLYKWDGTTQTLLATESGASLSVSTLFRIDIQVQNFGASATVTVYFNGNAVISYSGSTAISGVTGLDTVAIGWVGNVGTSAVEVSEVIVADGDTRALELITMSPNGAGSTQQWTGAYTDIDETTLSDADLVYTDTAAQDQQCALSDLPAGNFGIVAVRISARATSPAGSTATKVGLGVKNGATVDAGTLQSPGAGWANLERIMHQDPTTSANWALADMNGLQLNLRSGS